MSIIKRIDDLTGIAISYFVAAPNETIIKPVGSVLSSTFFISQSVIDESARILFSILLTMLSKWLFKKLEGPRRRRSAQRKNIKPAPLPESLTLNKKSDEKVCKQNESHQRQRPLEKRL